MKTNKTFLWLGAITGIASVIFYFFWVNYKHGFIFFASLNLGILTSIVAVHLAGYWIGLSAHRNPKSSGAYELGDFKEKTYFSVTKILISPRTDATWPNTTIVVWVNNRYYVVRVYNSDLRGEIKEGDQYIYIDGKLTHIPN